MPHQCVICGDTDSEGAPLLELPCFNHWVCPNDISSYFENAANKESLFPPQCCDQPLLIERFDAHVPEDIQQSFRFKEQGEYTVLPKYRVYCADQSCGQFLHPNGHITDENSKTKYAVCDKDNCFQATCCSCKALLDNGIQDHVCAVAENERKFKETVEAKGYKECFVCGATVELAEACNHITCECGNNFCYICGKEWNGLHGCPHYGPAVYDVEGYNQDGFHQDTGLNRDGRSRREQRMLEIEERGDNGDGDDDDDEDREDDGDEEFQPFWQQLLNHVDPEQREHFENLGDADQEAFLLQLQVQLIEQGVTIDIHANQAQPHQHAQDLDDGDEGEVDDDSVEDNEDEHDDEGDDENDHGPEVGIPENFEQEQGSDIVMTDVVDEEDDQNGNLAAPPLSSGESFVNEESSEPEWSAISVAFGESNQSEQSDTSSDEDTGAPQPKNHFLPQDSDDELGYDSSDEIRSNFSW